MPDYGVKRENGEAVKNLVQKLIKSKGKFVEASSPSVTPECYDSEKCTTAKQPWSSWLNNLRQKIEQCICLDADRERAGSPKFGSAMRVTQNPYIRSIRQIWWEHRISNTEVKRRVLGRKNTSVIEQLHHHRLRWLGHVLRMSDDRLPRNILFAKLKSSWKMPSGGQQMNWQRNMKSLIEG